MVRSKSMKKPRSGGEKVKGDAAPGEIVKSLAKSCRKDRYSCWAVFLCENVERGAGGSPCRRCHGGCCQLPPPWPPLCLPHMEMTPRPPPAAPCGAVGPAGGHPRCEGLFTMRKGLGRGREPPKDPHQQRGARGLALLWASQPVQALQALVLLLIPAALVALQAQSWSGGMICGPNYPDVLACSPEHAMGSTFFAHALTFAVRGVLGLRAAPARQVSASCCPAGGSPAALCEGIGPGDVARLTCRLMCELAGIPSVSGGIGLASSSARFPLTISITSSSSADGGRANWPFSKPKSWALGY
ncbi:hypothetical protein Anapl_08135 [Anas platyrhynchos]|uniref:Uncharacterized protein n=1 Tax=Anas platyrhynchos TaxID=8839 RepID=R0KAS1_ANAPL|nr:hypothetical protein Anapl_08135 [Anas platyrhynchos]